MTPRKTQSDSRKMIGNAKLSAFARSSPMIVPTSSPTASAPPTFTGCDSSDSRMRLAASPAASSEIGFMKTAMYDWVPSFEISVAPPPSKAVTTWPTSGSLRMVAAAVSTACRPSPARTSLPGETSAMTPGLGLTSDACRMVSRAATNSADGSSKPALERFPVRGPPMTTATAKNATAMAMTRHGRRVEQVGEGIHRSLSAPRLGAWRRAPRRR